MNRFFDKTVSGNGFMGFMPVFTGISGFDSIKKEGLAV
jgi:hypothetical protein